MSSSSEFARNDVVSPLAAIASCRPCRVQPGELGHRKGRLVFRVHSARFSDACDVPASGRCKGCGFGKIVPTEPARVRIDNIGCNAVFGLNSTASDTRHVGLSETSTARPKLSRRADVANFCRCSAIAKNRKHPLLRTSIVEGGCRTYVAIWGGFDNGSGHPAP